MVLIRSNPLAVYLLVKTIENPCFPVRGSMNWGFELIQELKEICQSVLTITVPLLINKP